MIRTTIFTSANRPYEMFVLPYVVGALVHNDDARVEICLENAGKFEDDHPEALDALLQHFDGDRFLFRDTVDSAGVSPNSVRFLETPRELTEFTYIGDIDILILEAISQRHIDMMAREGRVYSNAQRPGRQALSGLHFTKSDAHYPVERPTGIDLNRDEELLYTLVASRGHPPPPAGWPRPMHGYHLSPNRSPRPRIVDGKSSVHWGLDKSKALFDAYRALRRHPAWQACFPRFDRRYRMLLGLLDLGLSQVYPRYKTDENGEVSGLLTDLPLVQGILAGDEQA